MRRVSDLANWNAVVRFNGTTFSVVDRKVPFISGLSDTGYRHQEEWPD